MKNECGFSLLEVLVAIVIFSFGLLGLAQLQLVGLAGNQSATIRTMATSLAYDMSDRMRANLLGVNAGNYNSATGADNACRATHYDDVHATPANCTVAQLAQDDMYEWNRTLLQQLPSGAGVVCIDSTPDDGTQAVPACDGLGNAYAVKVWWNDKPKNEAALTKRIAIGFQP
jgi:type IV pilus assembly protein PilV